MFAFSLTILELALIFFDSCYGQGSNPVTFGTSSTTMAPTTAPPATSAPQISNCQCVPTGTCNGAQLINALDIRIVNQGGSNNCPSGQVWCCGQSGGLADTTCGIRKITDSAAQPVGIARYGAYPWEAALLALDNTYIGAGVLVSANYVLTAAHKLTAYSGRNFTVRLGEWDARQTTEPNAYQEYTPAQVIIHPNYNNQNLQNDLAIIRLNRAVPISSSPNINTACMATAVPAAGTTCWVSGWGKDAFTNGNYQSIMKEVDVPIVDQGNCETRLRATRLGQFFNLDRTSFMCAGGEPGKDACTGDGGAPLVCQTNSGQWQVVGLVAWGIGCAGSGVPGVYVNIPNFRTWITQQTGISR